MSDLTTYVPDEPMDVDRLTDLYREQASDRELDLQDGGVLEGWPKRCYVQGRIDEYIAQNAVSDEDVAEADRRSKVAA